jgi:hypothetical protein
LTGGRGKEEAADALAGAAIGRARDDALIAMAWVWRAWALDHPGRYQAAQRGAAPGDAEHEAVAPPEHRGGGGGGRRLRPRR